MKAEIIKITALNGWQRTMTIKYESFMKTSYHTINIPEYMYEELKQYGVPTGQALSRKKK